jgi:integrase
LFSLFVPFVTFVTFVHAFIFCFYFTTGKGVKTMPKIRKTKGIYRRGRVYWVTYMGVDGKQKFESTGSTLKADADLILAQRRLDVDQGKAPISNRRGRNFTFSDLAEKYLPFIASQKSAYTKGGFVSRFKKDFGEMKLSNFSLSLLEEWQSRKLSENRQERKAGNGELPPLKPASVNRALACLKHMFTKALDWEMVSDDIFNKVRKVKMSPENNRRLRYLSFEEITYLLNACDKHLKPIVIFAINTGCRRGEILGLTWDRTDLTHGFIHLDDTKSGKRREVPINGDLRAVLEEKIKKRGSPYVFVNPAAAIDANGKLHNGGRYCDIKKSFATACQKAGISDFHFHDLRHTFASQLVMNGVDITTVSKLLGHANLTMTLRYAHLAPNHLQKAVDVLSNLSSAHEKTKGHA